MDNAPLQPDPMTAATLPHPQRRAYNMLVWAVWVCMFGIICWISWRLSYRIFGVSVLQIAGVVLAVMAMAWLKHCPLMYPGRRAWIIGLLAFSLAVHAAFVLHLPTYRPAADFRAYHEAGVLMSQTWTQGQASASGEGYRCLFPPGQIFALGVIYRIFGPNVLAAELYNAVLASLTVVGIYLIARRLWGERPGRVAGVLAAILPSSFFGCIVLGAEVPETFWLVLATWIYLKWVDSGFAWKDAIACGLCLGVGALIRPTYLLLPVPIGLHMLLSWPRKGKALLCAIAMALGLAAVVAPWTWRNYKVTGGLIVISSNGGGNLWSGNNDDTRQGLYTDKTWQWLYQNARTDLELQQKGTAKAREWIASHPRRFAELSVEKFQVLWRTDNDMAWWAMQQPFDEAQTNPAYAKPTFDPQSSYWAAYVCTFFYLALVAAALIGAVRHAGSLWRRRGWIALAVLFFYFTTIHMVFETQAKYHYMLVPLLCVFAALVARRKDEPMPEERGA